MKLRDVFNKVKHYMSTKQFKLIMTLSFVRFTKIILEFIFYMSCFKFIRRLLENNLHEKVKHATPQELDSLFSTGTNLSLFISTIIIVLILNLFIRLFHSESPIRTIKSILFMVLIMINVNMPLEVIHETPMVNDKLFFVLVFLLLIFIVLTRVTYLIEIEILISLGIINKRESEISVYYTKHINYNVYNPNTITKVNKNWLPYVQVTMEGKHFTRLSLCWEEQDTSQFNTIVIRSKLTGATIKHKLSSIMYVKGYSLKEEA